LRTPDTHLLRSGSPQVGPPWRLHPRRPARRQILVPILVHHAIMIRNHIQARERDTACRQDQRTVERAAADGAPCPEAYDHSPSSPGNPGGGALANGAASAQEDLTLKPSRATLPGHIGGTSPRDLPRNDENRREPDRRSEGIDDTFSVVMSMPVQDPAYRPTRSSGSG
jgi:hypothetical protein